MKKIIIAILIVTCILSVVSCSQNNEPQTTDAPQTNAPATEAPETEPITEAIKEIALTPDNISEYLKITATPKNVKIKDEAMGMKQGTCDLEIQTFLLKNVDLDGVKLKLNCTAGSTWYRVVELEVPFNGTITETFQMMTQITDKFISSNPMFKIEIQEVSGKAILK
jgi:hypothetical protein